MVGVGCLNKKKMNGGTHFGEGKFFSSTFLKYY